MAMSSLKSNEGLVGQISSITLQSGIWLRCLCLTICQNDVLKLGPPPAQAPRAKVPELRKAGGGGGSATTSIQIRIFKMPILNSRHDINLDWNVSIFSCLNNPWMRSKLEAGQAIGLGTEAKVI